MDYLRDHQPYGEVAADNDVVSQGLGGLTVNGNYAYPHPTHQELNVNPKSYNSRIMNTFFTSDTHFGHKNIIEYCNRPASNVEEMDEILINRWNSRIQEKDQVYHLGDFAFCSPQRLREILSRLRGKITLIVGNHDKGFLKKDPTIVDCFEEVTSYAEISIDKNKIVLFHFPIEVWNKCHHSSWHLHGHSHGSLKTGQNLRRLDVGVDTYNLYPYSYEEVKEIMKSRGQKPLADHHGENNR